MKISNIFSDESIPIHRRYSLLIESLEKASPVLKTDLWNELNTSWPIKADFYVELDKTMVDKAIKSNLNAIHGSITKLPIPDQSVSTIIDLSTIDHIDNPKVALKEYNRVLKSNGNSNCYIVVWLGDRLPEKMSNWNGYQFYFDERTFIKHIYKTGFKTENQFVFNGWGDHATYLKFFHLKKAGNINLTNHFRVLRNDLNHYFKLIRSYFSGINKPFIKYYNRVDLTDVLLGDWNEVEQKRLLFRRKELEFQSKGNDPFVIIKNMDFPSGYVFMKICITPPRKTDLQIFYLVDEGDKFTQELSVSRVIHKRRSVAHIYIPHENILNCLRVDFGNIPGRYIVHSINIYSMSE